MIIQGMRDGIQRAMQLEGYDRAVDVWKASQVQAASLGQPIPVRQVTSMEAYISGALKAEADNRQTIKENDALTPFVNQINSANSIADLSAAEDVINKQSKAIDPRVRAKAQNFLASKRNAVRGAIDRQTKKKQNYNYLSLRKEIRDNGGMSPALREKTYNLAMSSDPQLAAEKVAELERVATQEEVKRLSPEDTRVMGGLPYLVQNSGLYWDPEKETLESVAGLTKKEIDILDAELSKTYTGGLAALQLNAEEIITQDFESWRTEHPNEPATTWQSEFQKSNQPLQRSFWQDLGNLMVPGQPFGPFDLYPNRIRPPEPPPATTTQGNGVTLRTTPSIRRPLAESEPTTSGNYALNSLSGVSELAKQQYFQNNWGTEDLLALQMLRETKQGIDRLSLTSKRDLVDKVKRTEEFSAWRANLNLAD
jgi:hypothetical protein